MERSNEIRQNHYCRGAARGDDRVRRAEPRIRECVFLDMVCQRADGSRDSRNVRLGDGVWVGVGGVVETKSARIGRAILCNGCGSCSRACPTQSAQHIVEGKKFAADCYSCARCLRVCPEEALSYGFVFGTTNGKQLADVVQIEESPQPAGTL